MAAQPFIYSGQGFSLQRDKGRFVLPALFRRTVRESSFDQPTLCIVKHERWNCLTGFGKSRTAEFADQIDREETQAAKLGKDFDRDARAFQLYGFVEVPFDDSGRFVLPQYLADLCGITDQIYFQGAGSFFTLFAPAELDKMGGDFAAAQAACRHLQADAAKGKKA